MKIIIWNIRWAKPGSIREKTIKDIISNIIDPDKTLNVNTREALLKNEVVPTKFHSLRNAESYIICITEGYLQSWSDYNYVISSEEDYGYKIHPGRRKVILISKEPWIDIDYIGDKLMPLGRFISAKTQGVNVIGLCIPWKEAHVKTGKFDFNPLKFLIYLNHIETI